MANRKLKFKTEVQELLDLMIHSLYSNKDIFLRELISNSSDALDKMRLHALTNSGDAPEEEWRVKVAFDKEARTVTVEDNGIGMTEEEVIANIGTIARSGTRMYLENLKASKEAGADSPNMIGQFGVGFYSAFMVSDKVVLETLKAGDDEAKGVRWESAGDGFRIGDCDRETPGTRVIVHLREGMDEYLEEWKLRQIIKKFSDYVEYPIQMDVEREEPVESEDGEEDESAERKTVTKTETINSCKAIWLRPPSEVTDEEYTEFYHHVSHDFGDPARHIHYSVEGMTEFKALVYIPAKAGMDMFNPERKRGIHLYVRRVFIMDDCEELCPEYLRFVKGVVESSDLPLNVSREILQEDTKIARIRASLVKKVLDELASALEKDREAYAAFFSEFGPVLKEGIHSDFENRDKLTDLLLYSTTKTEPDTYVTLKEYVDRMPQDQAEIYYITGESRELIANSPLLESFANKNYEVLLMADPIDEWVMQSVTEYSGKKFKAAGKGDIEVDESEKEKREEQDKRFAGLLDKLQKSLEETVKEVRLSQRLTDSVCCLVVDENDMSAHMERLFAAMQKDVPKSKRIMEINAGHPLVETMLKIYESDSDHPKLGEYAEMLYDQALMTEGGAVRDPRAFSQRLAGLMNTEAEELLATE